MQINLQPDGKSLTGTMLLRLVCVNVVMENGSELDRKQPFSKAQEVFDFVTASEPKKTKGKP